MTEHRPEAEATDAEQALIQAQFLAGEPTPDIYEPADMATWRAANQAQLAQGDAAVHAAARADIAASLASLDAEAAAEREAEARYEAATTGLFGQSAREATPEPEAGYEAEMGA